MALTEQQEVILRLLARNRIENPESYVAGGLAFNYKLDAPRLSRDIDIFHDSNKAMVRSWEMDRDTLVANGFDVKPMRILEYFIEAEVSKDGRRMEVQWGTDSAYRFFPLQPDPVVGFTLHPLDLAANKLSALVGCTEPRDWIDVITAIRELQPFACLLSAACGKDPGFSPTSMLEYVARRHYNQVEIDEKIIPKGSYDAGELCRFWHAAVESTRSVLVDFPRDEVGKIVMTKDGRLFKGDDDALKSALAAGELEFHEGTIGGAWPRIIG
jgi:hypothetical protein